MLIIKYVLAADVNIDARMSFVESEPHVNNQLENVFVNHISLVIQTICACHVSKSSILSTNICVFYNI